MGEVLHGLLSFLREKHKSYYEKEVAVKVRVIFDPPLTSSVLEAMNKEISQLEWRLNVAVDPAT